MKRAGALNHSIGEVTDAWLHKRVDVLAPYITIADHDGHTRLTLDTEVWGAIMDELDRRSLNRQEMRAVMVGCRSWHHLLDEVAYLLQQGDNVAASALYLQAVQTG
jgi:hypothetical protein